MKEACFIPTVREGKLAGVIHTSKPSHQEAEAGVLARVQGQLGLQSETCLDGDTEINRGGLGWGRREEKGAEDG